MKGWSGDVTLTPLDGNDLVRVELRAATGARVHVTDSAGTDTLQVWGTSLRENLIVDTTGGRGQVRQRATTGLTGTGTEIVDDGADRDRPGLHRPLRHGPRRDADAGRRRPHRGAAG